MERKEEMEMKERQEGDNMNEPIDWTDEKKEMSYHERMVQLAQQQAEVEAEKEELRQKERLILEQMFRYSQHPIPVNLGQGRYGSKAEQTLMTGEKRCSGCKEVKSVTDFGKDSSRGDGLNIYCLDCNRLKAAANALKNKLKAEAKVELVREQMIQKQKERAAHEQSEQNLHTAESLWTNRTETGIMERTDPRDDGESD